MNKSGFVLVRHCDSKTFGFPKYYVSVTYRDLNKRKIRWAKERQDGRKRPRVKKWKTTLNNDPYVGLVVKISKDGIIDAVTTSDYLHGILLYQGFLLSASHHEIVKHGLDLSKAKIFSSLKQFNYLHSIRISANGLLVASTGIDSISEISPDGKSVLWDWWATDNGYTKDSFGKTRHLDKYIDHRQLEYGTWLDTVHVNAAAELNKDVILATLFMTGELIAIDRNSGRVNTILTGLKRPHAIRVLNKNKISFADTQSGTALFGKINGDTFVLENSVTIKTNWLQDCQIVNNYWVLVDGEHSRVYFVDSANNILGYDQFYTDWYLYETVMTT